MNDTLEGRLIDFIGSEVAVGDIDIDASTDLLLTGAVDSLGVIRITQWIDDETGVTVDPADVTLENFQTIGRMLTYIESRAATAGA